MSDFIREVDEEVRQERFRTFLERYWVVLAALVVLVLAGVGAWKGYEYVTTQKAEAAAGQYLNALDLARDGKSDDAVAALKQVESDGTPGYRMLARFRLAGETGIKDPAAGATLFDALGSDASLDPALQLVAKLRAAMLLVDRIPIDQLKTRLEPLADANSPVRNAARELLALAALKADDTAAAGKLLDAIETDPTTSQALRQRTEALLGLVHGAGEAAATPAAAPVPTAAIPAPAAFTPAEPNAAATTAPPAMADPTAPSAPPATPTPAAPPSQAPSP